MLKLVCIAVMFNFVMWDCAFSSTFEEYTDSPPLSLRNVSDSTITGLAITNPKGHCIKLSNCKNIKITNCKLGPSSGNGVDLYSCEDITIEYNWMEDIQTGVYAHRSQGIVIEYNQIKNVQGPFPRGQMTQFNEVNGGENRINYNRCENILGESYPEDAINIYKSNGTVSSPIQIVGNWIRGGGPSNSGGGIMTGDGGGSYILVEDNILVDPGQYGIAIASGTNIQILNNMIYGKQQPFTNVGLYVWNQYDSECADHIVEGNMINFTNRDGNKNPCWNSGNCANTVFNNQCGAKIDSTILPEHILTKIQTRKALTPQTPELKQNYPNPFNPSTTISYRLPHSVDVEIAIFNTRGQLVRSLVNEQQIAGSYSIIWNGSNDSGHRIASGLYFYKMTTNEYSQTRKLVFTQ